MTIAIEMAITMATVTIMAKVTQTATVGTIKVQAMAGTTSIPLEMVTLLGLLLGGTEVDMVP